jgi:DNA-binding NarL/FixJ family response regulator
MKNLLLIEDDSLLRQLLATALTRYGFVVSEAGSSVEAKRLFNGETEFSVAVVDINLGVGRPSGYDAAKVMLDQQPDLGIVFLTNLPDLRFIGEDLKQSPKNIAYIRKSSMHNVEAFVEAIESVMVKNLPVVREDKLEERELGNLTNNQLVVLQLVAAGKSNKMIGEELNIGEKAVEDTVRRIVRKLKVESSSSNSRVAIARAYLAAEFGLAV